jgi:hypothetical protein
MSRSIEQASQILAQVDVWLRTVRARLVRPQMTLERLLVARLSYFADGSFLGFSARTAPILKVRSGSIRTVRQAVGE